MFISPESAQVRRRRIPTALASLLAIGLLAAACGSATSEETAGVAALPADAEETAAPADEADDTPVNPEDVSPEDAEAAQLKFDQCMTDQGVDQDELFGDVGDGNSTQIVVEEGEADEFEAKYERYEAALEECEPILKEAFGDFTFSPEQEAELADAEAAFNQCMTDKGFDMGASGDGEGAAFEISGDVDIDELQGAADECGEVYENLDSIQFGDGDDQ